MDGRLKWLTIVLLITTVVTTLFLFPSSITGAAIFTETFSINETAIAPNDVILPEIIIDPIEMIEGPVNIIEDSVNVEAIEGGGVVNSLVACGPSASCVLSPCNNVVDIAKEGTYITSDIICPTSGDVLRLQDNTSSPSLNGRKYFDCKGHTIQSNQFGRLVIIAEQNNITLKNCVLRYTSSDNGANNIPIFINLSNNTLIENVSIFSNQPSQVISSPGTFWNNITIRPHNNAATPPNHVKRPIKIMDSDQLRIYNYDLIGFPYAFSIRQSQKIELKNGTSDNTNTIDPAYLLNESNMSTFFNITDRSIFFVDSSSATVDNSWLKSFIKIDASSTNNYFVNSNVGSYTDGSAITTNTVVFSNEFGKYTLSTTNLNVAGQVDDTIVSITNGDISVSNNAIYSNLKTAARLEYYNFGRLGIFLKDAMLSPYTEVVRQDAKSTIDVPGFSGWQVNLSPNISNINIFSSNSTLNNTFENVSVSATATDPEGDQTRLYSSWQINTGGSWEDYYDIYLPFDDYHSQSNYSLDISSSTLTSALWGDKVSWIHRGGTDNDGVLQINDSNAGLNLTTPISGSHTACLFYQNLSGGNSQEFYHLDGASEIRMFHWQASSKIRFFLPGQTYEIINPSSGNPVHLCYTYNDADNNYMVYVNGELNHSTIAGAFTSSNNVYLGMKPGSPAYTGDGIIDDFMLLDHVVTPDQIRLWSQGNYTVLHATELGVGDTVRSYIRASDDYSYSTESLSPHQSVTGDVTECFDTDSPGTYTLQNNLNGVQSGKNYCVGLFHDATVINCGGNSLTHTTGIAIKDESVNSTVNDCSMHGYALGILAGDGLYVNNTIINVTDHSIESTDLNLYVQSSTLNGSINSTSGFNVTLNDTHVNSAGSLIEAVFDMGDTLNLTNVKLNNVQLHIIKQVSAVGQLLNIDTVQTVPSLTSHVPFKSSEVNRSVNITNGNVDSLTFFWSDVNLGGADEASFVLKKYNGSYYNQAFTLNTGSNTINTSLASDQITLFEYTNAPPPAVSNLQLFYNYSHLNCSWNSVIDPDGDVVSYNVTFIKDGVNQSSRIQPALFNSTSVPYEYGATWACSVRAYDSIVYGPLNTSSIMLNNTPPLAENFQKTLTLYNDTTVDVNITYEDVELHDGLVNFSWYVNAALVYSTQLTNIANGTVLNTQLSPPNFTKGDTVKITVRLNDSYNETVYNFQWSVQNSLPVITGNPVINYNGSTLNCGVAQATDVDTLDPLSYNFSWYKNNVFNSTVLTNTNFTNLNVTFNPSDAYNCSAKPFDGTAYGASTPNTTYMFSNTPPVWTVNFWVHPATLTNALFNATYTDANLQNGSVNVTWYVNSVIVQSEIVSVDHNDSIVRTLTVGNFSRGDLVNVTYNVTDGTDNVFSQNSSIVANSGPTSTPEIVATHVSNTTYENLTFIPGTITDPEGDSPNVSHIGWTRNSLPYYLLYAPLDTNVTTVTDYSDNEFHGTSSAEWNYSVGNGWFETGYWDPINFQSTVNQQTDYSLCFNLKLNTLTQVVLRVNSSTNTHKLNLEHHATRGIDVFLDSTRIFKNDAPLSTGVWNHHCILINNTHIEYYIDGIHNFTDTHGPLNNHNPNNFKFNPNGAIDNITVVNGTLSPEQIQAYANGDYSSITSSETQTGDVWSGIVRATDYVTVGSPVATNTISISGGISQCVQITQGGVYNLTNDLSGTKYDYGFGDEACVYITSSNVELNCDGYNFTVDDGVSGDTAIAAIAPIGTQLENITIKNCNINDYYRVIDTHNTVNSSIENVTKYGGEIIVSDSDNMLINDLTSINTSMFGVHSNNSNLSIENSLFENDFCVDTGYSNVSLTNISCTAQVGVRAEDSIFSSTNVTMNTSMLLNFTPVDSSDNIGHFIDTRSNDTDYTFVYDCALCTDSLLLYPGTYNLANPHYTSIDGYVVNVSGNMTNITINYSKALIGMVFDENKLKMVDTNDESIITSTLNIVDNTITFTHNSSAYALVEYGDASPSLFDLNILNMSGGNFIGNTTRANASVRYIDTDGDNATITMTWAIRDEDKGPYADVYNETHYNVTNNSFVYSNLSSLFYDRDDIIRVTAVATSNGLIAQLASGRPVNNSVPVLNSYSLVAQGNNVTNETLSVVIDSADADNDTITLYTRWYHNNVYKPSLDNVTVLGSGNTTKGDVWNVTLWLSDSLENSTNVTTNNVTILNSPPGSLDINLTYYAGILNCSVNQTAVDLDGDGINYEYNFYKDNVFNYTQSWSTLYLNRSIDTGHLWNCSVSATDGSASGPSIQRSLNVSLDTIPYFLNPFLRNDSSGMSIKNLSNATASGIYLDNESHTGDITFRWHVQDESVGAWLSVYNQTITGAINNTTVSSILNSTFYDKGDNLKVNWSATANGLDSVNHVIYRMVDNTVPVMNSSLNGSSPVDNLVVKIIASDDDLEPITNNTLWYKNNVLQAFNGSLNISSGNLTHSDLWNVTVWVNDSDSNTTKFNFSVIITDKPLVVDYVNLSAACNVNATANFTHTDYELSNATGHMLWYVNNVYVYNSTVNGSVGTIFNSSLYHGNFSHNDSLNITVNITDGINNLTVKNSTILSCPPSSSGSSGSSSGGGGSSSSGGSKAPTVSAPALPLPLPTAVEESEDESEEEESSEAAEESSGGTVLSASSGGRGATTFTLPFRIKEGQHLEVVHVTSSGILSPAQLKLLQFNNKPLQVVSSHILPAWFLVGLNTNSFLDGAATFEEQVVSYPFMPNPVLPQGDGGEGEITYTVGENNQVDLLYDAGFFKEEDVSILLVEDNSSIIINRTNLTLQDNIGYKAHVEYLDDQTIELYAYHPGGEPAYLELVANIETPSTYCRFNICELLKSDQRYVEQYGPFTEGLLVQQFTISEDIQGTDLVVQWRAVQDGKLISSSGITGNVVGYGIIHILTVLLVSALLISYLMVRDVLRD